jgi:hypothetical protein
MSRYFMLAIAISVIALVALLLSLPSLLQTMDSPGRTLYAPGTLAAPVRLADRNEAVSKIFVPPWPLIWFWPRTVLRSSPHECNAGPCALF